MIRAHNDIDRIDPAQITVRMDVGASVAHSELNSNVLVTMVQAAINVQRVLRGRAQGPSGALVFVDGLNRTSPAKWLELETGAQTLASLGIHAVYAGPPRPWPSGWSLATATPIQLPVLDPRVEPDRDFLLGVLQVRTGDAFSDEAAEAAVEASGGIIRNLLHIAQLAVQVSYAEREDRVQRPAVWTAVALRQNLGPNRRPPEVLPEASLG